MKNVAACFFALAVTGVAPAQPPVDYRFDEVRRNVVLTTADRELKVDRGQLAHGGDKVQTGFFSYALIASERYRAKFEIFSSTNVQLTAGTPGVILSLQRGRLRAVFDKIIGDEPRIVQTPGALLAVRGTKYDVEVDGGGQTTVDVWEGVVELQSPALRAPIFVRAGQESRFGRHEAPRAAQPIPENRRKNDPNHHGGEPEHGHQAPRPHGAPPSTPPPMPQPSAPPPHPPGHP
jgi:FecR-like protein